MVSCSCNTLTHLIFVMLLSDVCGILLFLFVFCIGLLSFPLLWCWWCLCVLCELHHTFSFSWATHCCMTPSDMLHLISSRLSSSFHLSSAVWEPLFSFPFVSSLRPFYGCFYRWVSFSSAQTFDPLDPANYHLLSTAWFLLKWTLFLTLQEIHVGVKALSLFILNQHMFFTLFEISPANKNLHEVCWWMFSARLERSSWFKKTQLDFHPWTCTEVRLNFFQPGVLHEPALNTALMGSRSAGSSVDPFPSHQLLPPLSLLCGLLTAVSSNIHSGD